MCYPDALCAVLDCPCADGLGSIAAPRPGLAQLFTFQERTWNLSPEPPRKTRMGAAGYPTKSRWDLPLLPGAAGARDRRTRGRGI